MSDEMKRDIAGLKQSVGHLEGTVGRLEGTVGRLEGTVGRLAGTVGRLEGTVDRIAKTMADLIGTVAEMKEAMPTKQDISGLNSRMDGFSGLLLDMRHRWAVHADTLAEHDKRLKKLESPAA